MHDSMPFFFFFFFFALFLVDPISLFRGCSLSVVPFSLSFHAHFFFFFFFFELALECFGWSGGLIDEAF